MKKPLNIHWKSQPSKEIGFGNKAYSRTTRLINPRGESNVRKEGLKFWSSLDPYHELINITWARFFLILFSSFFLINLLFAFLYFLAGEGSITGLRSANTLEHFIQAFYFSAQTITTVGYGTLSPNSNYVSILSTVESFIGWLGFALATGLMFSRFSKPRRNLVYSKNAIISPYRDTNGFMFRFANGGKNQLIETEIDVLATFWDETEERRIFQTMRLERSKISFFSTSWTVVHPIDEKSPLYGMSHSDMANCQLEIIIMFKAFDNTYARMVYDRRSYSFEQIIWGKKFVSIFNHEDDKVMRIDMEKIGHTEDAVLN